MLSQPGRRLTASAALLCFCACSGSETKITGVEQLPSPTYLTVHANICDHQYAVDATGQAWTTSGCEGGGLEYTKMSVALTATQLAVVTSAFDALSGASASCPADDSLRVLGY